MRILTGYRSRLSREFFSNVLLLAIIIKLTSIITLPGDTLNIFIYGVILMVGLFIVLIPVFLGDGDSERKRSKKILAFYALVVIATACAGTFIKHKYDEVMEQRNQNTKHKRELNYGKR